LLFEFLTRPILGLRNDLWGGSDEEAPGEDVRFEVQSRGSGIWLDRFWRIFFAPSLAELSERLEPIVWSHLQLARSISQADEGIEGAWDSLSLSRNLIEVSDHGRLNEGLGVLVDSAYELTTWNINNKPVRSDALIGLWFSADSFLLKRLSILAVALSGHWPADRKLSWLLEHDLLYTLGLKHEVFTVLKDAYPRSSDDLRGRIVARANGGRKVIPEGAERSAEYEKYNLMVWLHQSDPKCSIAQAAFDQIQAAHGDFGIRERPDLDVVIGPVQFGLQSLLSVEELLAKPISEHLDFLLSYEPNHPFGPSRDGLTDVVYTAATRNFEWGWQLAKELEKRSALKTDLWSSLIRAWACSALQDIAWRDVLALLDSNKGLHEQVVTEIANLLEDGIKKASRPIPSDSFAAASDLSKTLWALIRTQQAPAKPSPEPDWVMRAINHPAGRLTLFWLSWLARLRKEAGSNWKGVPLELREIFGTVLDDDSYSGELGRLLLASQLNLFFRVDEQWARDHLLPLFDWTLDGKQALQAFHGFLTWGQQTEELLPHLLPMYDKAFPHIAEFGHVRDRFAEYLAGLAVTSSVNPIDNGWLDRFVGASHEEDRLKWASHVRRFLRGSNDTARSAAWQNWIRKYWSRRDSGLPVKVEGVELGEMVEWALFLAAGFPEVAEIVSKGPNFELSEHTSIIGDLADTSLANEHPDAAARFLLKILQNMKVIYFDLDRAEDIVKRVLPLGVPKPLLRDICNEMARLGYAAAGDLQMFLDS
jgi:Domain of unknown function (DUF4020)